MEIITIHNSGTYEHIYIIREYILYRSHLFRMGIPVRHPSSRIALRHPPAVATAMTPITVRTMSLQVELLGHRVHLLEGLCLLLLSQLLHRQKSVLPELYPLGGVAHTGVFYQCTKDHKKADAQVNVYRLHVGNFGQSGVHTRHQSCHCQHRGDSKPDL